MGYPLSDIEVETQDEDEVRVLYDICFVQFVLQVFGKQCFEVEGLKAQVIGTFDPQVYWLQFGQYFAKNAIVSGLRYPISTCLFHGSLLDSNDLRAELGQMADPISPISNTSCFMCRSEMILPWS